MQLYISCKFCSNNYYNLLRRLSPPTGHEFEPGRTHHKTETIHVDTYNIINLQKVNIKHTILMPIYTTTVQSLKYRMTIVTEYVNRYMYLCKTGLYNKFNKVYLYPA